MFALPVIVLCCCCVISVLLLHELCRSRVLFACLLPHCVFMLLLLDVAMLCFDLISARLCLLCVLNCCAVMCCCAIRFCIVRICFVMYVMIVCLRVLCVVCLCCAVLCFCGVRFDCCCCVLAAGRIMFPRF